MKVVINTCFGGFGLSPLACQEYLKRKGKEAFCYSESGYPNRVYKKIVPAKANDFYSTIFTRDLGDKPSEDKIKEAYADKSYFSYYDIERHDPDLVFVVESLGDKANGNCAKLKVIEIPDDVEYEIDDYDGQESVHEVHRSWC